MPTKHNIPLSLYIHIPWCLSKCPYCDFNSYKAPKIIPEEAYIKTLLADLNHNLPKRKFHSIFIGGGTPSLFSPQSFTKLLDAIPFNGNIEITVEANPGTITKKQLRTLRNIGINRISIGIQSFQNDKLKLLGRIHNDTDAQNAVKMAQDAGFNNINIDLMFGIPKQTINDALFDLETAFKLNPNHLSWYQLTIEPNTVFYKNRPQLPDEDTIWEIQQQGQKFIAEQNFEQYEISAYSKPNFQCQHNLNYWQFGDYLGLGVESHSKITDIKTGIITRITRAKETVLSKSEIILEFMLNALRLYQPIPLKLFTARTGLVLEDIKNKLDYAQDQGFLTWNEHRLITSQKGKRFLNDLIEIFIL